MTVELYDDVDSKDRSIMIDCVDRREELQELPGSHAPVHGQIDFNGKVSSVHWELSHILSTPATGSEGSGRARSGIRVADIENPDLVYSQVKELVSRAS